MILTRVISPYVVVLKNQAEGTEAKARQLIEWAASKLVHYKRLSGGIVFISEMPRKCAPLHL